MINFDDVIKEETKEHNPNCSQIPDHPYRILIIGGSGSGKTNSLFNLINQHPDIDKIYLYAKDSYEAKYQFLIKKREDVGTKHFNDLTAFIEYSNDMGNIYKNIEEYNPNKKRKILIVFEDMIADMLSNKLNISLVCLTQSYFAVPKNISLYSTHCFIMKIPNKRELQQIAFNHSLDIDFQDFMNLYQKCTAKSYSFLVTDATLASDNPLCFRKNLIERI